MSIRFQLALLVLVVILPAFGVAVWYLSNARDAARVVARDKVKILVDNTVGRISASLRTHELLLAQIAAQPQVRAMDAGGCDPIIQDYLRLHPEYVTIGTRDLKGNPVCTFRTNPPTREQVASYPWFQSAVRSDKFEVGSAFFAPLAKRWVTTLTMPVRDTTTGQRNGMVVVPLDLFALNRQVLAEVPGNAVVSVTDRKGDFVLRSLEPEQWISKPAPATVTADTRMEGFDLRAGADGVRRVVAFRQMPEVGWRVAAGVPEQEVFAAADAALRNGVLGCLALLLAALALAWRLSQVIVRPLEGLAATAGRVAQGDTAARAPMLGGPTELESVAAAFNHMLDARDASNAALRASEENLAITLQSIGDAVVATDVAGQVRRMNPSAERLTGWTFAEAEGRPLAQVFRIVDAQARTVVPDPVSLVLAGGRTVGLSNGTVLLARGGQEYQIANSAAPIRDSNGQVMGVVLVFSDVTAQYQTQQALREALNFSRQIINSLPLGLNVRDTDGVYREWNPAMARIATMSAEQTLGRTMAEALPDQPRDAYEAIMDAFDRAKNGEALVRPDMALDRDGVVQWTSASHGPLRDAQGNIVGMLSLVQDITPRKLAEQALRQSEEDLSITLQSIGDAVLATDAQGRVTRMNAVAERLTGWSLQEARGQALASVFRIFHADTREPAQDPVQRVLESGQIVGLANHTYLLARDGTEYQISDSAAPIRDSAGLIVGVVLVFSDVSEQYRLQRVLVESETRYRALVESSPIGVYVHRDNRYLYVNPAAARLFGASAPAALLEQPMLERIHPDCREGVLDRMRFNLEHQVGTVAHEERFLRLDGSVMDVEIQAAPVVYEGRVAFQVCFLDITARKLAEQALRRSEENLAITLQSIGDAVIATDLEGAVTRMNPVAERMTGWPLAQALGQPLTSVFRIADATTRAVSLDPVQRVLESGQVVGLANHTLLLARDGAEYQIADSAAPIRGADGEIVGVVLVFSDVTEQYRLQSAVRESEHRYRALVESSPVGVAMHRDGKVIYANPMAVNTLGAASAAELMGRDLLDFVHPDFHALVRVRARQAAGPAAALPMTEWQYVRVDGAVIDVQAQATVVSIEGQSAVQVSFLDISARKQAERTLRENEARFRALTHLSSDWYWEQDEHFRFVRMDGNLLEMTGRSNEEHIGKTRWELDELSLSAVDWEQHRAVLNAHQEFRDFQMRRKDHRGQELWVSVSGTPIFDTQGRFRGYRGVGRDVTAQKLAADQIHALAFYDALTELPNRRLLIEQLKKALVTHARSHRQAALLFIDLDNFKTLNDTLGHETGDHLLRQVAQRLLGCVREADSVARLGGDEFVVMLQDLSEDLDEAATQAELVGLKILAAFGPPFALSGREYRSTPSIGVALFGKGQQSVEDLLKHADLAMYQAKAAGRNTLRMFDQGMQAAVEGRAALESDLRDGLERREMLLHYQPIMLVDGRVTGAEALVRWQHPVRGRVSPGEFIPVAEATRLILPLGQWVMDTACAQLAAWSELEETRHLTLSVNVSVHQFVEPDFVSRTLQALDRAGADPRKLKLELTESLLADNMEDIIRKMEALRERGIDFSLDDFGTGYSSLSYLKRLPLSQLKIDQSFVRDVLVDPNDAAIARTILALGASLGLAVVAEGVETEGQYRFLVDIGCSAFQGYLFGRPVPVLEFNAFVRERMPRAPPFAEGLADPAAQR